MISGKWWLIGTSSLALHLLLLAGISALWDTAPTAPEAVSLELIKQPKTSTPRLIAAPKKASAAPLVKRAAGAQGRHQQSHKRTRMASIPSARPARFLPEPRPKQSAPPKTAPLALVSAVPAAMDRAAPAPSTNKAPTEPDKSEPASPEPRAAERSPAARLPSVPPRLLRAPRPPYPAAARRQLAEGVVIIRAWVNAAGRVAKAALHRSSGSPELDRSALSTIQSWRFAPGTRQGKAAGYWVKVPIRFQLQSQLF